MLKKLTELEYGQEGVIHSIGENIKPKLCGMGIRDGKVIRMDTKQPIQGPVVVTVDKSTTSLGFGLAKKIFIEVKKQ
ncbi:MAG: ferrous iron transport protein A [Candidatus Acetothermia bacterium]